MAWYAPWTWFRREIEASDNSAKSNLEKKVSKPFGHSIQRPDGEFAGKASIGSRYGGSYTNEEILGPGRPSSSSYADEINSAEANGIHTGAYSH